MPTHFEADVRNRVRNPQLRLLLEAGQVFFNHVTRVTTTRQRIP